MNSFKSLFIFTVCFFCFASQLFAEKKYEIIDLEIPNAVRSEATGLNENGQVCGLFYDSKDQPGIFFWDPVSGAKDIGVHSPCWGKVHINNNGVIAFCITLINENGLPCHRICTWDENNGIQRIAERSDANRHYTYLHLYGINDAGQILYQSGNGLVLWDQESSFEFSDKYLHSAKINNRSELFGSKGMHVLWHANLNSAPVEEVFQFTGLLIYLAFNDQGVAAGTCYINDCEACYGFIWSEEKGFELLSDFRPICLNNAGDMVGNKDNNGVIYIRRSGETNELKEALDLENDPTEIWNAVYQVCSINCRGEMIGVGRKKNSKEQEAVLLSPISNSEEA